MTTEVEVALEGVTKRFGDVTAVDDVSLQIGDGEFFSLLGPSGCGKTTTLRMIAGFEQPTAGEILIAGQPVAGIPAHRRPVNTVFQSYALFPHMTVWQNVAFGLEMKKISKDAIHERVRKALELVQMPQMADRRPKQLSGGQQQRVALARALVNRPQVLLLDEPLGALDLKLRKAMQLELKQIQSEVGITFIYVTHDQEEALTMSDRIAVMDNGLVQQVGTPRQIYEHPANRFVADFIGETNFIPATVVTAAEITTLEVQGHQLLGTADGRDLSAGQEVTLAVRPEKINLYPFGDVDLQEIPMGEELRGMLFGDDTPKGSIDLSRYLAGQGDQVAVAGRVDEAIYIGTDTRYRVTLFRDLPIFVRMQNYGSGRTSQFQVGDSVLVHWRATNAQVLTG